MDRVSKVELEDSSLKSALHQLVDGKTQNVIELSFGFREKTVLEHSSEKSRTFKKSSRVLGVEGQEFSCSLSEFSQHHLDSPDFSLVLQTEGTDQLQPSFQKAQMKMRVIFKLVLLNNCIFSIFRLWEHFSKLIPLGFILLNSIIPSLKYLKSSFPSLILFINLIA